jgi:anti-sigma-K factor RskA
MDSKEYIESGILELYVYGLLDEKQNQEIHELSKTNKEIEEEILSIEKSILSLSTSFSPFLSSQNFEKIRQELDIKHGDKIIKHNESTTQRIAISQYIGWAAAAVFLIFIGYQFQQQAELIENNKKLNEIVVTSKNENEKSLEYLNAITDNQTTIIPLAGQKVAPKAFAKIYWNKKTQKVYVDATGLPEPPTGKEYQIWSLKLKPALTPRSIGLLSNFTKNTIKLFEVSTTNDAEAFGITLEPKGGSKTPTMEQLYTLGAV